ncbi:universal stress protein [Actinoplanes sp. LDG1-06]|uniref:Universal stress protein n=1 Tax=Paractinoplanes ovalisporus TaxID=2810368 RepID=A0ABS2A8Z1_9ACTN|nr:universal stress protein [Actinoplanes ovalisporus]MBM2616301.1 universal stress protein [Actinoplanes ovalisporus]
MSDLDKLRTEQEARRPHTSGAGGTRYSDMVDRYLSMASYSPERTAGPAAKPVASRTGLVIAGVDDSPASYIAVDHAAIEAQLRGWDLRLVHAQRPTGLRASGREAGARLMERMIERVHACAPAVAVTSRLVTGSPAPLLLVAARDAGLVVVGHRHGTPGAVFGISVGDRVAADHTGAVLVVRVPGWPPGPGVAARPVVAGVDGDDSETVGFAHREARLRGSDLVLLHACRTPRPDRVEASDGVRMRWRYVAEDPAQALVEASSGAAALVIGRRGPGGLPAGPLGSVSRSVVQHAHCPVFLVG